VGYSVNRVNGCIVIKGVIPADELASLLSVWPLEWVLDGELANALSVCVVVGPKAAIDKWRRDLHLAD
jgi:hypothetical protein